MANKLNNLLINIFEDKNFETYKPSLVKEAFSNETVLNYNFSMFVFVISESSFTNIVFTNVNFCGSYCFESQFNNCTFNNTIFHKVEWTNCQFNDCQFNDCLFTRAEITETIFQSCDFTHVNFIASILDECKLINNTFNKLKITENGQLQMSLMDSTFCKNKDDNCILLNDDSELIEILKDMNAFESN